MAHYKIISLTTEKDGCCCLDNCTDYSFIGADYGGDPCPGDTENTIDSMFGDLFYVQRMEDEEKTGLIGELAANDPSTIQWYAMKSWESFKDRVASFDYEDFKRHDFDDVFKDIHRLWDKDIIYVDGSYITPMEFLIRYAQDFEGGTKFYINGCIDFHS